MNKLKLAIALGSTCSGCDIAILDLNEKILNLVELVDIVYWPTAMDFKLKDLEGFKSGEIDVGIYHGTVRTSTHEHTAHLLRDRAGAVLSFGSCACFGGIPGLCNLTSREEVFRTVYQDTASTVNPDYVTPQTEVRVGDFDLTLPELSQEGRALHQVIDVEYSLPGCPPVVEQIEKLVPILKLVQAGEFPPKGTVIASDKTLCDECPMRRDNKSISRVVRTHTIIPTPGVCLLEQGLICMGPATRGGCGARCIKALMPCRGCMGPTAEVKDQGAKMVSALASILGVQQEKDLTAEQLAKLIGGVKDPVGTFYRFTLATAFLNKKVGVK
ncbi:MAG: oxidoreductase [Thermodesulfobacteriota bacterium]